MRNGEVMGLFGLLSLPHLLVDVSISIGVHALLVSYPFMSVEIIGYRPHFKYNVYLSHLDLHLLNSVSQLFTSTEPAPRP